MVPWSCRGGRVCSCDDMHNDGVLTPRCVLGRSRADTFGRPNICHTFRMSAVPRSRSKLLSCAVALVAGLTMVAGCASGSDATAETSAVENTPVQTSTVTTLAVTTAPPDLVGSWEGSYAFPTIDGALVDSPLLVVIERQEGTALWGYEQFDDVGQVIRIPFTGSFDADGQSFGLAATGLTIIGTMAGADQMNLRFFRVADPPTSFQVMVERTSSPRS